MPATNIAILLQNGRRRFIQAIALTSTASLTTINATTVDGVPVGPDCTLAFQSDADCFFTLQPLSTVSTTPITATSAGRLPQYQWDVQKLSMNPYVGVDGKIEGLAVTTANLMLYLLDPS